MRNGMAIRMTGPSGRIGMMRLVYSNHEGKGGDQDFLPVSPEDDPVVVKIEAADNVNALKDIIVRQQSEISLLKQMVNRLNHKNTVSIVHIDRVEHLHTSLNEVLSGNVRFSYKALARENRKKSALAAAMEIINTAKINLIFVEIHNGSKLDLNKLRKWLEENFVHRVVCNYDWFALWRYLKDHDLIRKDRYEVTDFVKQMRCWYPEAKLEKVEEAINLYKSGYLGDTPFNLWDERVFMQKKNTKQSIKGFRRLHILCDDLNLYLNLDEMTV